MFLDGSQPGCGVLWVCHPQGSHWDVTGHVPRLMSSACAPIHAVLGGVAVQESPWSPLCSVTAPTSAALRAQH